MHVSVYVCVKESYQNNTKRERAVSITVSQLCAVMYITYS